MFDVVDSNGQIPSKPVAQSPVNRAVVDVNIPVAVTFSTATDAVTAYQVQRFGRVNYSWSYSEVHAASAIFCSSTSCCVETPGISMQNKAIWRVRAHNAIGWSPLE